MRVSFKKCLLGLLWIVILLNIYLIYFYNYLILKYIYFLYGKFYNIANDIQVQIEESQNSVEAPSNNIEEQSNQNNSDELSLEETNEYEQNICIAGKSSNAEQRSTGKSVKGHTKSATSERVIEQSDEINSIRVSSILLSKSNIASNGC